MTPLQQLILDKQFEKNASVMEYARRAPGYLRSLFSVDALREAKNIFKSYPGQVVQAPKDIHNLGFLAGVPGVVSRLKDVNVANPKGAPIAFLAPKVLGPLALSALALKGDSSKAKVPYRN